MSAESPRRGSRGGGVVIRPQPVSDKTVVENVVNFFSDVALTGQKSEDKEKVQWVRFERTDINDVNSNPDCNPRNGVIGPLLIVIGYTNGVQIWTVPASGEAQEVLSLRQGPIRILRLLPNPISTFDRPDIYATKRPLVAVCDASSAGQPYCSVKFLSLRTGDEVNKPVSFSNPLTDIQVNDRVVVVAFPEKIAVFDSCQFRQLFWITTCYPCSSHNLNPIALGYRWLAYADKKLVPVHQSSGGMTGDGGQSYAATVISAAKTLTKGLSMFSETVASSLTGGKPHQPTKKDSTCKDGNGARPGVVTIVDVQTVGTGQVAVQEDVDGDGFIAHFPAHATEPVSAMQFDPSGTLLLTADRLGHNFHLFRIMAHPTSCSLGSVHHLYTLYRGDTTAKVQDIVFTLDSRWVAISTVRGTTHIFPITPYGGSVTVRTHTSQRMVNRASRFQRSAGLDDMDSIPSGRDSPAPTSGSPGSSPGRHDHYRHHNMNTINNNFGNPRLPPFPHPTTICPLVQIKHGLNIPGLGGASTTGKSKGKPHGKTQAALGDVICVTACFAPSRGWIAGSPTSSRDKQDLKRAVDSLFIINWMGNLIEYVLEPRAKYTSVDKVTDESPLEVIHHPRAQWTLVRNLTSSELRLPLPNNNPLLMACDAVILQKPSGECFSQGMGMRQESKESLSSDHSLKDDVEEQWLSQVEIITHAGPHRRLWMGPQFTFKTFQGAGTTTILPSNPSVLLSQSPEPQGVSTLDIVGEDVDLQSLKINPSRSSPVSMPGARRSYRLSSGSDTYNPSPLGTFIEAGSYEQSPSIFEANLGPVHTGGVAEDQLKEHLADAMSETHISSHRHGSNRDLEASSLENLSTSSGSACSGTRGLSYDARSSPPHSIEHVLVFPSSGGGGSPDST